MKSNFFKYIFIIFVIGIMIFAFFKIRNDEKEQNETQAETIVETPEKITEIRLGIAGFDTINPIFSTNKNIQEIINLIYEPLVKISNDYKVQPALAKEWAKQNENSYIIKLRENVKWSNGEKFTSADVQYTIEKLKQIPSIYSHNVQHIVEIEIVDDYTLKLILDAEVPFFEYNLAFPILSKTFYDDKDFNDTTIVPAGIGMYSVTDVQSNSIILTKNTNWWDRETKLTLDKITINIYSSAGELYNPFKIGNIDLVSTSNINIQEYIGTIGYTAKEVKGREHDFIALNTANYFLAKQEVRKAISYSIDKTNIISSIYQNKYYTSSFPLDYGSWVYQEQDTSSGYNAEQAKQLLVENKWSYKNKYWQITENYRTQKLELNFVVKASNTNHVAVAENIKTQLENQGIRINIMQYSDEQYNLALTSKAYDMILCSVYLSTSPDLTTFFGDNNLANYQNDEVREIMKQVKNTTDENIIKEKYKRLAEIYKTDIPYISLYNNKHTIAYNTALVGEIKPNWYQPFYGVETWYK